MLQRIPGDGWIALLGGGEFSFGETLLSDRAWVEKTGSGTIGFVPAASGSQDYAENFSVYLADGFGRQCELIPIYRSRDARRGRNRDRVTSCAAVYVGGGVADELLTVIAGTSAQEAMEERLRSGGNLIAVAAAAQAFGAWVRPLRGGAAIEGLAWLPQTVVEANFDPAHDRRLRELMTAAPGLGGVGIPAGASVMLGPGGEVEVVGTVFVLDDVDGDYRLLE